MPTWMPVGRKLQVGDLADRIGQRGDLLQPLGHRLDRLRRQRQPVDERGVVAGGSRAVRRPRRWRRASSPCVAADRGRHRRERGVLGGGVGAGEHARRGARGRRRRRPCRQRRRRRRPRPFSVTGSWPDCSAACAAAAGQRPGFKVRTPWSPPSRMTSAPRRANSPTVTTPASCADLRLQRDRVEDGEPGDVEDHVAVVGGEALAPRRLPAQPHELARDVAARHRDHLDRQRKAAQHGDQLRLVADADELAARPRRRSSRASARRRRP